MGKKKFLGKTNADRARVRLRNDPGLKGMGLRSALGRLDSVENKGTEVIILTPAHQSDVITLSVSAEVPTSDIVSLHFGIPEVPDAQE